MKIYVIDLYLYSYSGFLVFLWLIMLFGYGGYVFIYIGLCCCKQFGGNKNKLMEIVIGEFCFVRR